MRLQSTPRRVPMLWRQRVSLLFLLCFVQRTRGLYVSYETPVEYREGDDVPITVNKLVSPSALSAMDYKFMPVCPDMAFEYARSSPSSVWKQAVGALHGDSFWRGPSYQLQVRQDVYCQTLCVLDLSDGSQDMNGFTPAEFQKAIQDGYAYHFMIDGLPVAYRTEDDVHRITQYWQGIPIGQASTHNLQNHDENDSSNNGDDDDVFVYNHLNIEIFYTQSPLGSDLYRIYRTVVEPFSIETEFLSSQQGDEFLDMVNPAASCRNPSRKRHVSYDMIQEISPQRAEGRMLFTYDVRWVEYHPHHEEEDPRRDPYKSRWDIFLTNDHAIPSVVEFVGVFTGILMNALVWGALMTWILRDWSYKPLAMQTTQQELYQLDEEYNKRPYSEEEEGPDEAEMEAAMMEVRMWPLSRQIFFPPVHHPEVLCILMGTGAQIILTGGLFIFLFRSGLVSQSMGAGLLTPGLIVYVTCGFAGGYVTGRLYKIFHGEIVGKAIRLAALTASAFPFLGLLVVHFVYDVLPDSHTPAYHVVRQGFPILLLWLFVMIPWTMFGGYMGHKDGPVQGFPISEGSGGYQDLALPVNDTSYDNGKDHSGTQQPFSSIEWLCSCWNQQRLYIPQVLMFGGALPVLGCFVGYAYGVAGPVFVGYYSDPGSFMLSDYGLFLACGGGVSTLLYYKQIRQKHYTGWWWSSYAAGASSGIYIFVLTLSWLFYNAKHGQITGRTFFLYTIWFAYLASAVSIMSGFVGVTCCCFLNRTLYSLAMRYE